jgi:hypothetical protein
LINVESCFPIILFVLRWEKQIMPALHQSLCRQVIQRGTVICEPLLEFSVRRFGSSRSCCMSPIHPRA